MLCRHLGMTPCCADFLIELLLVVSQYLREKAWAEGRCQAADRLLLGMQGAPHSLMHGTLLGQAWSGGRLV